MTILERAQMWLKYHPRAVMREPCDCCGLDENEVADLILALLTKLRTSDDV